jgi:hypothetical protein
MFKKLKQSLLKFVRYSRAVWGCVHPRGWPVFLASIAFSIGIAILLASYVRSAEVASKHHTELKEENAPTIENGTPALVAMVFADPLREFSISFALLNAGVVLLAIGILCCLIAHKYAKGRRIQLAIKGILILKFLALLLLTIQIAVFWR